ncbi:MAG: sulfite exporter TauE/SafE family protein [Enhydrobacter sp.]|nr:MAG: sulfite exporter TauE/SafE family protein [Enhydrobacter sp.]
MIDYAFQLFAETNLWLAVGVTLVAGLMRGFAGFGSAMLMAPIFAILFGSAEMVVTVVAIELVVSVQLFPQVRHHADWKTLTPMSVAACAAMPLGVWLLASVDKNTIVTAVSAVIVAFVVLMWTGWKYRGRRSPVAAAAVGTISGAMMATTSVGGPPVLLYLLSGTDPPQVNRANIVTYYFLTQFLLIVIVLATGVAGWDALARAVVLFPVMTLGAWMGGRLFHGLGSERLYRNVALVILFGTGSFGLLRTVLFA